MTRPTLTHPVSPSRIFFYLFFLTALAVVQVLSFQSRSVSVTASTGTRVEAVPGKLLTLSFRVSNTAANKKRFESTVAVPTGWRRLAKDFPFELEPGASDIRLLNVSIPAETPAGEYVLRFGVRDPLNLSDAAEVSMTIVITAVKEQAMKLIESPRLAVAGEPYVSVFLLNNKGNITTRVRLTARSSTRFPVELDSSVVHLKPGESRTFSVKVSTDPSLTSKVQDVLDVTAELDTANSVKASSYVDVVPRITGAEERYIKFPLRALVRFAGEQSKRGTQLEISGSGPLGNIQEDRLDLLVRTPDIQQKSILGRRDEYQLSYTTKLYDVYLGDKNFSLSPLTEFNRYAFGASGNATINDIGVGGFYNESRFFTPKMQEWAGYLTYHIQDGARVGINYLGKRELNASDVVTLRTIVQPFKSSEVDLEYGLSNVLNKRDNAYSAKWSAQWDWIAYDARYVRSGSNYAGYYKDVDLKNISLNLSPLKDVRIEGYYRDEERNLNRDTTLQLAPRDRYYQVGIDIANLLAVYYRSNDRDDLLPVPRFRTTEETWQVRVGYNLPSVTIIANADFGATQDKLEGINNPFHRYTAYLSIQPFSGHTYGFSAEYTKDRDPTTLEDQERVAGSVNVGIFLGEATQFSLALYGNRTRGSFEQTYSLLDISLEHTFPWAHSVTLRGRQSIFTPSLEGKEIAYLAEYSIPIGVPVARSTVNGQLVGKVMDSEKGVGIQNVLVYAGGATALTDRNGEYYFPSLKPDKYFVQLDMPSVGLNRVTLQQLPHEVTIVGGQESRFDITLSRSITISGTVLMFGAKEQAANDTTQPAIVELGGHPNVIVELVNGDDLNRRVTDNRGRFTFTNMRPGHWTLRIADGNLPQNYYFDKEAVEFDVAPGQAAERTFKALPKRRRIQMISQGVTIAVSPEKGKGVKPPPEKKAVELAPQKPKLVEMAPPKEKDVQPAPEIKKPVEPALETKKPVEPAPQIVKPAETFVPKQKTVGKAPPKETPAHAIVPPQPTAKPEQVPCVVVFWPEKLVFGIHHSDYRKKSSADSAAVVLAKKSVMNVFVGPVVSRDGRVTYRVLLGAFKSRKAAEKACDKLQYLK